MTYRTRRKAALESKLQSGAGSTVPRAAAAPGATGNPQGPQAAHAARRGKSSRQHSAKTGNGNSDGDSDHHVGLPVKKRRLAPAAGSGECQEGLDGGVQAECININICRLIWA